MFYSSVDASLLPIFCVILNENWWFTLLTKSFSSKSLHLLFIFLLFHSISVVFFISTNNLNNNNYSFFFLFFLVFANSLLFLLSKNLFFFIIFYEGAIFPIFLILKNYGNYFKRNQASYFILIWALIGSLFLFLGLIFFYSSTNSWNFDLVYFSSSHFLTLSLFFFLLGFAVKVPMWPFHFWIARAHAEGPTNLSIFLSGVLVKLSIYGMLKVLEIFHFKTFFNIFFFCSVIGVLEATLKMMVQIDSKVVVAFSTTVQMNFILFLLFSKNFLNETPLKISLLNHMLTASLLFFICDIILVRFNSREFFFLSGLYSKLPIFSVFLLVSLINQINFPGFLGFLLDVSFLYSSSLNLTTSSFILFFFLFVIEHLYILFFFLKICFGVSPFKKNFFFFDLNFFEITIFFYLLYFSIFFGVLPGELEWSLFV